MQSFWVLIKESVIVQGTITMILLCAVVYMFVTGKDVPGELYSLLTLVFGFYFGSKVENVKAKTLARLETENN